MHRWVNQETLHSMVWLLFIAIQNVTCHWHCCHHCWNPPPIASLCLYPLFGLHKSLASISECQWLPFFPHKEIKWYTTLPCQIPLCQNVPLLPLVWQQQNVMQYCQEGSASTTIIPTSASDVMRQHSEITGITFQVAFIFSNAYNKTIISNSDFFFQCVFS